MGLFRWGLSGRVADLGGVDPVPDPTFEKKPGQEKPGSDPILGKQPGSGLILSTITFLNLISQLYYTYLIVINITRKIRF